MPGNIIDLPTYPLFVLCNYSEFILDLIHQKPIVKKMYVQWSEQTLNSTEVNDADVLILQLFFDGPNSYVASLNVECQPVQEMTKLNFVFYRYELILLS